MAVRAVLFGPLAPGGRGAKKLVEGWLREALRGAEPFLIAVDAGLVAWRKLDRKSTRLNSSHRL